MKGGLRDLTILTYKRRHVSLVMMVALWLCSLQLQSLWLHLLFPQQSFIFSHRWAILICLVCLFVFVSVYLSLFVDTNKIVCFWQYLFFNACLWLSVLSLSVTFLATLPIPLYVSVCLSFGLSSFLFVLLYLSLLKMFVPSSLSLCYRPRLTYRLFACVSISLSLSAYIPLIIVQCSHKCLSCYHPASV